MGRIPTPFSFILWDECFRIGYDRICQELWGWSDYVDPLFPPQTRFARLPWNNDPALYDVPECGENSYRRQGMVSVWCLLSSQVAIEDYFLGEDPSCDWEPLDAPLFWDDLGFILYPSWDDYFEADEPTAVGMLLDELENPNDLHLASFKDELIETCLQRSTPKVVGLYFVYDYDYFGSPVFGQFCSGLVEFVGSFSYAKRASE